MYVLEIINNSLALSDKIVNAGGTKFTNEVYWTVSEEESSYSNASVVNPLTGAMGNYVVQKTQKKRVRFVFAF